MGQKLGGSAPFWGRGGGYPSNTRFPGPRPICTPSFVLIHPAIWPQQIWAENCGGSAPFGEGSWVPIKHNVTRAEAYLHAKFHPDPSNHLATIHQHYRQTDRQTDRQWSDSIRGTVLQTVAQKLDHQTKLCQILTDFQISFTTENIIKFTTNYKTHIIFSITP